MEAPVGRVALFPMAPAKFRTAGDHTGLRWIEWNINQR
jgi:hypothetical protein